MKIVLVTHLFSPSIGGIETMSFLLARAFVARGHEVRVITATPSTEAVHDQGLTVIRRPSWRTLWREVRWCDVCFHNNISLSYAWPLVLGLRPWVVTSQTWILQPDGGLRWRERLKRALLRRAHSIAISRAVAASLPVSSEIIPNSYDAETFASGERVGVARDLIFVGRLVSDKGAGLALEALVGLRDQALWPTLTIVGDGPERERLRAQVLECGLADQVVFAGALQGEALAAEFRRHAIQLVPSRWAEPFGIVALEGAACGCFVIGSREGGLADAIGPCGATFPNGDVIALAEVISRALRGELPVEQTLCTEHLRGHGLDAVAECYLDFFQRII